VGNTGLLSVAFSATAWAGGTNVFSAGGAGRLAGRLAGKLADTLSCAHAKDVANGAAQQLVNKKTMMVTRKFINLLNPALRK
jgi:hypothetical protein